MARNMLIPAGIFDECRKVRPLINHLPSIFKDIQYLFIFCDSDTGQNILLSFTSDMGHAKYPHPPRPEIKNLALLEPEILEWLLP